MGALFFHNTDGYPSTFRKIHEGEKIRREIGKGKREGSATFKYLSTCLVANCYAQTVLLCTLRNNKLILQNSNRDVHIDTLNAIRLVSSEFYSLLHIYHE